MTFRLSKEIQSPIELLLTAYNKRGILLCIMFVTQKKKNKLYLPFNKIK